MCDVKGKTVPGPLYSPWCFIWTKRHLLHFSVCTWTTVRASTFLSNPSQATIRFSLPVTPRRTRGTASPRPRSSSTGCRPATCALSSPASERVLTRPKIELWPCNKGVSAGQQSCCESPRPRIPLSFYSSQSFFVLSLHCSPQHWSGVCVATLCRRPRAGKVLGRGPRPVVQTLPLPDKSESRYFFCPTFSNVAVLSPMLQCEPISFKWRIMGMLLTFILTPLGEKLVRHCPCKSFPCLPMTHCL